MLPYPVLPPLPRHALHTTLTTLTITPPSPNAAPSCPATAATSCIAFASGALPLHGARGCPYCRCHAMCIALTSHHRCMACRVAPSYNLRHAILLHPLACTVLTTCAMPYIGPLACVRTTPASRHALLPLACMVFTTCATLCIVRTTPAPRHALLPLACTTRAKPSRVLHRVASFYYLRHTTMEVFARNLGPGQGVPDILQVRALLMREDSVPNGTLRGVKGARVAKPCRHLRACAKKKEVPLLNGRTAHGAQQAKVMPLLRAQQWSSATECNAFKARCQEARGLACTGSLPYLHMR